MRDVGGMDEVREDRGIVFLDHEKSRPAMRFCFRTGLNEFTTVYYWHYTFEPVGREGETLVQRLHRRWSTTAPSITAQVAMEGRGAARKLVEGQFLPVLDQLLRHGHLPADARVGCERLPIAVLRD